LFTTTLIWQKSLLWTVDVVELDMTNTEFDAFYINMFCDEYIYYSLTHMNRPT